MKGSRGNYSDTDLAGGGENDVTIVQGVEDASAAVLKVEYAACALLIDL